MQKIELINEWLTEQMNHWLLFPLILTFIGVTRAIAGTREPSLWLWVLFSLFPLAFFLLRYKVKNQEQELQSEDAFDLREKCGIEKDTQQKAKGLFSALSPRERVRRLYKKKLAAAAARMEPGDRDSLELRTAREWERKLSLDGMADLYEQARYSDREITGTDVKKMKDAWK